MENGYNQLSIGHFVRSGVVNLSLWQKFLDNQVREITALEERGPLLESCFQAEMVELFTPRAHYQLVHTLEDLSTLIDKPLK